MKLIRDIISEKRQMQSHAMPEPAAAPQESLPSDEPLSQDAFALVEEPSLDAPSDTDTSDEFAAFFAEDDDPFAAEADPAVEPLQAEHQAERQPAQLEDAPAAQPSKLVLGKAFSIDPEVPQTSQEDTAPALEEEEPQAAAPVQEQPQDAEQSLRNMFRELNEFPQETAEEPAPEPESDPAPDAEQHVSEMLNAEPAAEPEQDQPEAQQVEPEAPVMAPPKASGIAPEGVEVPKPAPGRGMSRHGRVKTRLLGFNTAMDAGIDPIKDSDEARPAAYTSFPVGWLIVVEGEGRGSAFSLFNGVSNIGRGTDQTVCLDFGDNSISREAHASIAYDPRQQSFFIGHCGKSNIVRRNDRPILSTEELAAGDHITIGETTLRFVPLCGPDFSWEKSLTSDQARAANG